MNPEEIYLILAAVAGAAVGASIAATVVHLRTQKLVAEYDSLREAVQDKGVELEQIEERLSIVNEEMADLRALKDREDMIEADLSEKTVALEQARQELVTTSEVLKTESQNLHDLQSKLDLYSRIDEFTEFGHFETPEYLYETSQRFAEEIKQIRQKQKDMIKAKKAVQHDGYDILELSPNGAQNKRILDGQVKLLLAAFNIECDLLIEKVSPSNYARTLERIEKLANSLEKSAATLHCGFSLEYVELKFEECTQQYQYKLRKQEEQEEQRQIREQMREEQKAIREYEKALREAEEEELLYKQLLVKARAELELSTDEERQANELKIQELEDRLRLAEEREQRAKSLAEQTKRGHVYIISNVGSFGQNIYKIGLTRRLDPMERVKELGDASVPFPFDVHAFILIDDAPALESALHKHFSHRRVNAVNLRKEFFRVTLDEIEAAAEELVGDEIDFRKTILAEEYFESRRLIEKDPALSASVR